MKSGKIVLGFIAGAAAGTALGILLAPDKGTNTSDKINKKTKDFLDELEVRFECFVEDLTKKYKSVKEETDDLSAKGNFKISDIKDELKNTLNKSL